MREKKCLNFINLILLSLFIMIFSSCNSMFSISDSSVKKSFGRYNLYEFQLASFCVNYSSYLTDEEVKEISYDYDKDNIELNLDKVLQNEYGLTKLYFTIKGNNECSGKIIFTFNSYKCEYKYKVKKSPFKADISESDYEEIYDVINSLKYSSYSNTFNINLFDDNTNEVYTKTFDAYTYDYLNEYSNYVPFDCYFSSIYPRNANIKDLKTFRFYYYKDKEISSFSLTPFEDDKNNQISYCYSVNKIGNIIDEYNEYYSIYEKYSNELKNIKLENIDIRMFLINKKNNQSSDDTIIAMFNDGTYEYLIKICYYKTSGLNLFKRK